MSGLGPGIHDLEAYRAKSWIAGQARPWRL